MKTYNDIYLSLRSVLRSSGIEAYSIEAKLLLSRAAGKTITELMRDINLYTTSAVEQLAMDYAGRRLRGEPVAYITETWEFYGLPMDITPDVLIPRMDTELMIDATKELLIGRKMDARILDLCCGSGCIACAVGHELPATHLVLVDLSASALAVARRNIDKNRLSSRAICVQADATASPPLGIGQFDVILSNPPYISSGDIFSLDSSVKDFEPIWALDGGKDGLKFYRSIIKYWKTLLRDGGYLLFEVGEGQADAVKDMLSAAGFSAISSKKDTQGIDRVVIGKK